MVHTRPQQTAASKKPVANRSANGTKKLDKLGTVTKPKKAKKILNHDHFSEENADTSLDTVSKDERRQACEKLTGQIEGLQSVIEDELIGLYKITRNFLQEQERSPNIDTNNVEANVLDVFFHIADEIKSTRTSAEDGFNRLLSKEQTKPSKPLTPKRKRQKLAVQEKLNRSQSQDSTPQHGVELIEDSNKDAELSEPEYREETTLPDPDVLSHPQQDSSSSSLSGSVEAASAEQDESIDDKEEEEEEERENHIDEEQTQEIPKFTPEESEALEEGLQTHRGSTHIHPSCFK